MKELVLKIYPKAYVRKHFRRTYFETDKDGIFSDVTNYQYHIIDDETKKIINEMKYGYNASYSNENDAWADAWRAISRSMLEKFEK